MQRTASSLTCAMSTPIIQAKKNGLLLPNLPKRTSEKYPDIIKRYTPFVLLSMAQGEVINEADRNDDKYEKRAKRTLDVYGYEDDISEQFHRELITPFADPFEQAEEERLEIEREQLRRMEIAKVRKVLAMMKPIQKERLCKVVLLGLSSRKIAQEEGINYNAVDKSIKAAKKNFKNIMKTSDFGCAFRPPLSK